jgi:hypothetical protein
MPILSQMGDANVCFSHNIIRYRILIAASNQQYIIMRVKRYLKCLIPRWILAALPNHFCFITLFLIFDKNVWIHWSAENIRISGELSSNNFQGKTTNLILLPDNLTKILLFCQRTLFILNHRVLKDIILAVFW